MYNITRHFITLKEQQDIVKCYDDGWMAEWLKALVLKTSKGKLFVGSNPTPSAICNT